ncbi:MAG: hypothetical protein LUD72_07930 [Bacteroidales bacterium]|nr:hypothetical protein [Bacteroidales bacterium]
MTIEGNFNPNTDRGSAGGVLLCPDFYTTDEGSTAYFNMYGGEIRDNYTEGGGGVNVYGFTLGATLTHRTYFYMYGGTIEENYAAAPGNLSGGGGVSVVGSANADQETYFYMYGGATIRDNVCSGPGAGVCAICVCQCSIAGRITGNRSLDGDDWPAGFCGVNINYTNSDRGIPEEMGRSVITIEGSAYIYGNYSNGKKSNFGEIIQREAVIYYVYITLGNLTEGARIGVTLFHDTYRNEVTPPRGRPKTRLQKGLKDRKSPGYHATKPRISYDY